MTKRIRIVQSPFNPPLEVVDDIVVNLHIPHMPYSKKHVTVQVNPNVQNYPEDAEATHVQVRQVIVAVPTDQTKVVLLDFGDNKKKRFEIENADSGEAGPAVRVMSGRHSGGCRQGVTRY
jgi:hypothetical protein